MKNKNILAVIALLVLTGCTIKVYHTDQPLPPPPVSSQTTDEQPAQPLTPGEKAAIKQAGHDAKAGMKKCWDALASWHHKHKNQS